MPLDIRPLSITASFNSIKAFFNSQENNSKWRDLTTGAEGNFLMRMLSNVLSVLSSRVVTGRREQFHDTANFMSSNIALAVNNGYSVFRGRNQRRIIRFTPNVYKVVPKMSQLAPYSNDLYVYNVKDITFEPGKTIEFEVVLGNLKTIEWTARTNQLKKFIRFEQGISEDYALFMVAGTEEKELPTTDIKKEMIYDKYYIYTNPWKSVTLEYLNNRSTAQYKYDSDTIFRLKYIELNDVPNEELIQDSFEDGIVENTILLEDYIGFEEVEDIKISSPIYRETQNLARSKADMADIIRQLLPTLKATDYQALSPSYTAVTYLKDNMSLLNAAEIEILETEMEPMLYFGRPFPDLVNPEREMLTLNIVLGLTNYYTDEAVITTDIQSVLDKYSNTLKQLINVHQIEKDLNSLPYVTYARVDFAFKPRETYHSYRKGDMIAQITKVVENEGTEEANTIQQITPYKCTAILGMSGQVEPLWNTNTSGIPADVVNKKLETRDNELFWVTYKKLPNITNLQEWQPNHLYKIGDMVYSNSLSNFMFKCVDIQGLTGSTTPDVTFTQVGEYIEDGDLLLICITYDSTRPARIPDLEYRLGDRMNISGKTFEVVDHLGKSSGAETLVFSENEHTLFVIPEAARIKEGDPAPSGKYAAGDFWFTEDLGNILQIGSDLKVSTVEEKLIDYYEVEPDKLIMDSILNVKVKKYDDGEGGGGDEPSPEPTPTPEPIPPENIQEVNLTFEYDDTFVYEELAKKASKEELNEAVNNLQENINNIEEEKASKEELQDAVDMLQEEIDKKQDKPTSPITKLSSVSDEGTPTGFAAPMLLSLTDEEDDPNKGWKELEAQLEFQRYVHKWIVSEKNDKLRVPLDVLNMLKNLGRITSAEYSTALLYYNEYSAEDEEQIYLYMDKYNCTRLEAINDLLRRVVDDAESSAGVAKDPVIGNPIADATALKYYNKPLEEVKEGEDFEKVLVYVDKYNYEPSEAGAVDLFYVINRYDSANVLRIERSYYKATNEFIEGSEVIHKDSTKTTRTFLTTIEEVVPYRAYNMGGVLQKLTKVVPTARLSNYYLEGSSVNTSYAITNDGRVRWEQIEDTEKNQSDWNTFNTFDFSLNLKY